MTKALAVCPSPQVPYILAQGSLFVPIAYFLIGFQATAQKFFFFFLVFVMNLCAPQISKSYPQISKPQTLKTNSLAPQRSVRTPACPARTLYPMVRGSTALELRASCALCLKSPKHNALNLGSCFYSLGLQAFCSLDAELEPQLST